jgi:transglutaminase-like putative cysteine protease
MRLHVTHRTRFVYADPVQDSWNEVRLMPTSAGGQNCEHFQLRVSPPASTSSYLDLYHNIVHRFDVARAHRELTVIATSRIDTRDHPAGPADDATPAALAGLDACARSELCHDFLQNSTYVEVTPELWRLGVDLTQPAGDVWQAARAIMRHIHRQFRYEPNTTHVNTRAADVLQLRAGVCQDFAHLMIGICRAVRIPARYVSGYLYNGPADQLRGTQASHAWAEVYVPGHGWCGLDPTNNQRPDGRYVKIGAGRDYADVPPLRGTYRGTAQRTMSVDVLVSASAPAPVG